MPRENSHFKARQNYDRLSRWYDSFSGGERSLARSGLQLLELQSGENILEIGFGTGHMLLQIAREIGLSGSVTGIDLSPGMLAVASQRIARTGLTDRIALQVGDATCLPFPDHHFQAVFMSFTLELFETLEIASVLAESRRVLAPGGRLGIVSLVKKDNRMVKAYEWFHAHYPHVLDCRPIDTHRLLEIAGFEVTKTLEKSLWGLPVQALAAKIA